MGEDGRGLARASPLGLWAGVRAAEAVTGRPWLVLAHGVRVDLIVGGAEHGAGLVTCRGPAAIVGSWSMFTKCILWARHHSGHSPTAILIKPKMTPWGRCHDHPQFTDNETDSESFSVSDRAPS